MGKFLILNFLLSRVSLLIYFSDFRFDEWNWILSLKEMIRKIQLQINLIKIKLNPNILRHHNSKLRSLINKFSRKLANPIIIILFLNIYILILILLKCSIYLTKHLLPFKNWIWLISLGNSKGFSKCWVITKHW